MIKIDPDNPVIPNSVTFACIATQVKSMVSENSLSKLPDELQLFLQKYEKDEFGLKGYEYEDLIMRQCENWTDEQIQKWIDIMPSGMCRAEMRAYLKQRTQNEKSIANEIQKKCDDFVRALNMFKVAEESLGDKVDIAFTLCKTADDYRQLIDKLPKQYRGIRRLYEAIERINEN